MPAHALKRLFSILGIALLASSCDDGATASTNPNDPQDIHPGDDPGDDDPGGDDPGGDDPGGDDPGGDDPGGDDPGGDDPGGDDPDPKPWQDPPITTLKFSSTDEIFLNPERGFYRTVDGIRANTSFASHRKNGSSLVYSYIRLDNYRTSDIPQSLLDGIHAGLANARRDGVKLILRFAYNNGPYPNSDPDASLSWVMRHIEQVTPLLNANADVIALVQAGFIGAWGEWHTSTNGLLRDYETKYTILEALLSAVPATRMVQLRYPKHKKDEYGDPLTPDQAYTDTSAARIGHHNDCFLASNTDEGTYPSASSASTWKEYLSLDTRFVPMGGETCAVYPARTDCTTAVPEMQYLNYTFINYEYHPQVVAAWKTQGCYDTIDRHIGYRFELNALNYPASVPPGGHIPLSISLRNVGWAAPFNARPLYLVLTDPSGKKNLLLIPPTPASDPRRWRPSEEITLELRIATPHQAASGDYKVALWLPDAADTLRDDARFAIRFANLDVWQNDAGLNHLATIKIDSSAPGSIDENCTAFTLLDE